VSDLEPVLHADLATIATWWPVLLDLPRTPGGHASSVESPPPVPIGVLSLRRRTYEQLGGWTIWVYKQRKLHSVIHLGDVVAVCRFLDVHADWLADRVDAVEKIGAIAADITELVEETQPRRILIGHCPDCAGKLIAILSATRSEVRCNVNGSHTWDLTEWRALNNRINGRTIRYEAAARRLVEILAKA
jgi:hypothetical protein